MEIDLDVLAEELRNQEMLFEKDRHFRVVGDISVPFALSVLQDIVHGYQNRLKLKQDGFDWRVPDDEDDE